MCFCVQVFVCKRVSVSKGLFTFLPTHQYLFSAPYTFTSAFFLSNIFYLLDMSHFRHVVLAHVVLAEFSFKLSPAPRGRHGERANSSHTAALARCGSRQRARGAKIRAAGPEREGCA